MKIKVGFGLDIHKLENSIDFFLGGIKIPHIKGALGHSDADVIIHSICDALLGAANKRDIGIHFPDNNPKYKGIDSKILLSKVVEILSTDGYTISNVDVTVCLQKPKIASYIPEMQVVLAKILNVTQDDVSIKATTSEHLGYVGREEGVASYAVVLIQKI